MDARTAAAPVSDDEMPVEREHAIAHALHAFAAARRITRGRDAVAVVAHVEEHPCGVAADARVQAQTHPGCAREAGLL